MDSPKEREKKRKIEDQMDEGIVKKEKKESKHLYFSQNHQDSGDGDCFLNYQKELDKYHDRCERLSKITRDVVTESKRIIFQLHRYTTMKSPEQKSNLMESSLKRLMDVRLKLFHNIAKEVVGIDQNLYNKPISFALQEYIEAWSFYKFISSGKLLSIDEITESLKFEERVCDDETGNHFQLFIEVSSMDYLLGLSDIGGELMRFAINQASAGEHNVAIDVQKFMCFLYGYFIFLGNAINNRDWQKKLEVFHQSLTKVENVLYKLKLRKMEASDELFKDYLKISVGSIINEHSDTK